jgi:ASC-1-like (ASCH) protein
MKSEIYHYLSVIEPYFSLIKQGIKTIELRLNDEKRQSMNIGDFIVIERNDKNSNLNNCENEKISAKIIELIKADNFFELRKIIDIKEAGFENTENLIQILNSFYSQKRQKKHGVLGIRIRLI